MLVQFYDNNTVSGVGNYRIVTISETLRNVQSVAGYIQTVTGGQSGARLQPAVRYTTDGSNWSLWTDFDPQSPGDLTGIQFDPSLPLLLEFRFTAQPDEQHSPSLQPGDVIDPPFTISGIELLFLTSQPDRPDPYVGYRPPSACSNEFCQVPIIRRTNFTFDPYAVNNAICLYKELSGMTNQLFGHEVVYYRVNPQLRSADVFLKEWTILNVEQQKCVKLLVPNNEFPDSKPQYNTFGVDFELPFEVHVDKEYWDDLFGAGSLPQEFDVVYFPLINRLYEVQSTYVYRDFMQRPLYFKMLLIKYQNRAARLLPDNIAQDLDALTVDTDELFAEQNEQEAKRVTKPMQYTYLTTSQDPVRKHLSPGLVIRDEPVYSNWTVVSENAYDLDELYRRSGAIDAVLYRAEGELGAGKDMSFCCWFRPSGGAGDRPLISSGAISVKLVYGGPTGQSSFVVEAGGQPYSFPTPVVLDDRWYAVVVNLSNRFGQAGIALWEPRDGVGMVKLYSKTKPRSPIAVAPNGEYRLVASPLRVTNLRVFDKLMEEEKQAVVLAQMVVQDSHSSLLVDNAKPQLKLPFITNPK